MKRLSLASLFLSCLISMGAAQASCSDAAFIHESLKRPISVEEILQSNLRAVRGESAIDAIDAINNMDAMIEIRESDYMLIARYRATADGHMRIDVFSEGTRVYSEGKDDGGVWEWPGGADAPENVHHDGVAALEHGIEFNLFAMAELPDRGHDVELVGCEAIDENGYFVLKITLADGFENFRYVNAETWLVDLSRDFRAFHPALDATKQHIETRYDQWQRVDGILASRRSQNVDLETGEVMATTRVLDLHYNALRSELDLPRSYVPDGAPRPGE